MKKKDYSPYATYNPTKIDAPRGSKKNEPCASKITGNGDLRGGNKK